MPTLSRKALRSVVFAALAKHGAKERDAKQLVEGRTYPLEIEIHARSGGLALEETVAGELVVGHAQQVASSKACDADHLVAYLLEQLPATRRVRLLEGLPETFAKAGGELPPVKEEAIAGAKRLLDRLRQRGTSNKAAAISFRPHVTEKAAA